MCLEITAGDRPIARPAALMLFRATTLQNISNLNMSISAMFEGENVSTVVAGISQSRVAGSERVNRTFPESKTDSPGDCSNFCAYSARFAWLWKECVNTAIVWLFCLGGSGPQRFAGNYRRECGLGPFTLTTGFGEHFVIARGRLTHRDIFRHKRAEHCIRYFQSRI